MARVTGKPVEGVPEVGSAHPLSARRSGAALAPLGRSFVDRIICRIGISGKTL